MLEHGSIRIRKKFSMEKLFEEFHSLSEDLGDGYKITYGSVDTEGYFIGPRKLKTMDTEVILGLNKLSSLRIHLGTQVGIIICRNMKRKITLLVIRKGDRVSEEILNKIVEHLVEFTGGKFHGAGIRY